MECNRDEANRAKEIAENKFSSKDMLGAKKFALKAQTLYPELDGISQLLATLDVYIAAENKINGESDFYAILGVNPSADDDTVRKHYRKLALFLHPDKNKSVGADGAFKYISEAWSMLSDKAKRSSYDQKRNPQNIATQNGTPPGQNGFYNFTKSTTTRAKGTTNNNNATTSVPSSSKPTTMKTFWTVCHGCKMQYEYLRMYLYQNLLCPNCHEPFLAMETPAPNTKISTKASKSSKGRQRSTSQTTNFQWGPFSKTNGPASSAQAVSMVQRAYEKVKREREEAQAAVKREEALRRKKSSRRTANYLSSLQRKGTDGIVNIGQVDVMKGVTNIDIRTRLINKARFEIKKKLHELSSKTIDKSDVSDIKQEEKEKKVDGFFIGDSKKNNHIYVTDSDFHDFDLERCEICFGEGQVWAAYDDTNGMPRYYAMISKVNSLNPFKINVRWLSHIINNEPGQFSGFSKAFGELRIGKHEVISDTNYFSHKVNFTKPENGVFQIYPRKGDVWALYRNWSPEWNDETLYEEIHKYEIVEVDEYDEDAGFTVTQLVKVVGFKTVFHRLVNPKEARAIPESEIFRFSHQIPSYLLTGQESTNALKGCRELDPAATPSEFLEVIADVHDDESAVLADVKEVENIEDNESAVLADVKEAENIESAVLADVKEAVKEER